MSAPPTAASTFKWTVPAHGHVALLQQFECDVKDQKSQFFNMAWRNFAPRRPWRAEVQGLIRQMPAPCNPPYCGILGLDDDGVAAAALFHHEKGEFWHIDVMGVSLRHQGAHVGDDLMGRVLNRIRERAAELHIETSTVTAQVHPKNDECIKMMMRSRFNQAEEPRRPPNILPTWVRQLATEPTD